MTNFPLEYNVHIKVNLIRYDFFFYTGENLLTKIIGFTLKTKLVLGPVHDAREYLLLYYIFKRSHIITFS